MLTYCTLFPQTSSSISIYQQHAAKLLSRKSVVLGIPIAAGSIILFLQWRKRKSLKPKPKPKSKQPESERKENKVEETRTNGSNGKATPSAVEEKITSEASAQNGSAAAPAPPPAYSSESYAAVAAVPRWHPLLLHHHHRRRHTRPLAPSTRRMIPTISV